MDTTIERPLSLTPELSTIIGNERSKQMISDAFDEGYRCYSELINDGWLQENALRSSHMTLVGSLESKVHQLASELEQ